MSFSATNRILVPVLAAALAAATACGSVHENPSDCTEPCAGDPVADFAQTQGGTNGRWLYLADERSANGATYSEMTWGTARGEPAWVGSTGASPPAILSCADNPGAAGCENLETYLMLIPGSDHDPAIAFVAQADGTYALTGKVRAATGDPEGLPQRFTLSRNTKHDLIVSKVHVTAPTPDDFSAQVELVAGDRLILAFAGNDTAVPVAFDFHLTLIADGADAFPGKCEFAATFDGADALKDKCRNTTIENLNSETSSGPFSVPGPSVIPALGDGRVIVGDQYLHSTGGPLDHSGDFTIQFWAEFDSPQPSFDAIAFNDSSVGFVVQDTTIDLCYYWAPDNSTCQSTPRPSAGWHFYRITRALAESAIELCIDGQSAITDPQPGTSDMTTDLAPFLGRDLELHPAYFAGTIDDVRAFKQALPCPTP